LTTRTNIVEALLPPILRNITRHSPHATAFTETRLGLVKQAAAASKRRWQAGTPLGVPDGVPFIVKDDLDVKGYKTHVGTSHDYTEGAEVETSWCVKKVEDEGAVMVGKMNMHELGSGESSHRMTQSYHLTK
jgi:Asp-tRNA(Asn)/Glu-tRNA(Gln) amidotransferase A subunit family amidase